MLYAVLMCQDGIRLGFKQTSCALLNAWPAIAKDFLILHGRRLPKACDDALS